MTLPPHPKGMPHRASLGTRGQSIVRTGGWALVAKGAAAANLFVSVPFVLHTLGPAEFGAWATLVSLVAFAGFLDFGFGNGAMNLIASAHGRGQTVEIAAVIHESGRALAWIALGLATVALLSLPWVHWDRLLGLPPTSAEACRMASAAVLFAIVIAVPLNLATRVQLGLGQGDKAFRWQVVGQLTTLLLVIQLAKVKASLPELTAVAVFTPLLAALANTVSLLRDQPPGCTSSRHPQLAVTIRREGLLFFVLQLAAVLAYSVDLPLVSALRGPTVAGEYAIVQRLFSIVPIGLALVWVPLWPLYRHALAAGDHAWVQRTLRQSLVTAMILALVVSVVLAVAFKPIAASWIGHPVAAAALLLAGFVLWCVVEAFGTGIATFLNAASIMHYQVVIAIVFAVLCLGAKSLSVYLLGTWAIPFAATVTFVAANILPTAIAWPRLRAAAFAKQY